MLYRFLSHPLMLRSAVRLAGVDFLSPFAMDDFFMADFWGNSVDWAAKKVITRKTFELYNINTCK